MKTTKLLTLLVMICIALPMAFALPTITGTITDLDTGFPIQDAMINIYNVTGGLVNTTNTSALGTYTADSVGSGLRTFNISAAGYDTAVFTTFISLAGATVNRALGPIAAYTLSGTEGNAVDGVTITVKQSGSTVDITTTSGGGLYSLNLLNGTYEFEASKAGFDTHTNSSVTVSGNTNYNFTLNTTITTGIIQGYVLNETGAALQGASVKLYEGLGISGLDVSDVNGFYSITYDIGTYDLTASLTGFIDNSQSVGITAGTKDLNITLLQTPIVPPPSNPPPDDETCGSCGDGNGDGSSQTYSVGPVIDGTSHFWNVNDNPKTLTIRSMDSIKFAYAGTQHTISIKSIKNSMVTIGVASDYEERSGFKGDVFNFKLGDDELLITLKDTGSEVIVKGYDYISVPTVTLKLFIQEEAAVPVTITEKVVDGIITVAAEIAPPEDASIPVGIGISVATIVIGLLLFIGIRKIWG